MTRRTRFLLKVALAAAVAWGSPEVAVTQTPDGPITIDLVSAIRYPTDPVWSPDGRRVAFLWDAAGKQDGDGAHPDDFNIDRF